MEPYIDDQWRDILAAQGFSPRTEDGAEVWRKPGFDALIEITHSDQGDPLWLFYVNRALVEQGDESNRFCTWSRSCIRKLSPSSTKKSSMTTTINGSEASALASERSRRHCTAGQRCLIDRGTEYILSPKNGNLQYRD